MRLGEFVADPTPWQNVSSLIRDRSSVAQGGVEENRRGSDLHAMALQWLKEDREHRRGLERKGRKVRGARRDQVCVCEDRTPFLHIFSS
jgi:CCR4-NOT complex subunit CAF16